MVPPQRPHVQLTLRAQALDLTRRSPDRPAEAAPLLTLQHGWEGGRARPPDALAALGGAPTRPPGSGPPENRPARPGLAGD